MATLNRAIGWYIDGASSGGRNALLDGVSANPLNLSPSLMQGDKLTVQLYFRAIGSVGADTTALELAAGYTLHLVGKLKDSIGSGAVLFAVSSWTKPESGDYYYGTLDLNTEALNAAFSSAADEDTLDVSIDIEYRDAGNTERLTFRVEAQIARQVYQGTEATPAPSVSFPLTSPSGYVFSLTIDDDGELSSERVS